MMERRYTDLTLAALFILVTASHASATILSNDTCGANLRLDCGNSPIVVIGVISKDRLTDECRAGSDGPQKVTMDQVRQRCEGKRECDFQTGFSIADMRYLAVHYTCGQNNDICSDVTILAEKSYFNLLDRAGIPGPAKCSCEAEVPSGTEVSVRIYARRFRSPGTKLTLKWRDDATFYVDQSTKIEITPYKHVVTDKFRVEYKTESGNDDLLLSYEVPVPIKMICNNGSEITPAPGPGTVSGSRPGEETSTSGLGKEGDEEEKAPIGVIVGVVVPLIVVAVVLVPLVVFLVRRRRRNAENSKKPKDPENVEETPLYETLTKKPGEEKESGKGDPVSEKLDHDAKGYVSITKHAPNSDGEGEKPDSVETPKSPKRGSRELPEIPSEEPRKEPKPTPNVSVIDSGGEGDYSAIELIDDSNANDKKGFFGWIGGKLGIGAKQKKPDQDTKESVKFKKDSSKESGQKGPSDVQEEEYDRLHKPLLTKPDKFMPESPASPNYDHVDPNIDRTKDSVKSNESKFNYGDSTRSRDGARSPNVNEEFPHKILPSAKLAKSKPV